MRVSSIFFPNTLVSPTAKPLIDRIPVFIAGRRVAPRRTGAQHPEHFVYKPAIVCSYASPLPYLSRQQGRSFNSFCGRDANHLSRVIKRINEIRNIYTKKLIVLIYFDFVL